MARRGYSWLLVAFAGFVIHGGSAYAGAYLNSAHANSTYGVRVPDTASAGYATGNCANCHEQHGSIAGVTEGPHDSLLFDNNKISQTVNICFDCHTDTGSLQSGGSLVNRSYSYRAGGYTEYTAKSVAQIFSFSGRVSSGTSSAHDLNDISTFIATKTQWGYTSNSNPCTACHDPHAAQGDPANASNSFKSPGSRGYPLSRPSLRANRPWGLWGSNALSERMSSYTNNYQAPYRFGSTSTYEPDGSATQNGANLTDYVTFCTDCHNTSNTIYSTVLGRNLRKIDWSATGDKHGRMDADGPIYMLPPYTNTPGYVLSCLDCHEPHGSLNSYLLREEVNGSPLQRDFNGTMTIAFVDSGSDTPYDKTFGYLCRNCHQDDYGAHTAGYVVNNWDYVHMDAPGAPYSGMCWSCHQAASPGVKPIPCINCHYHGSSPNITPNWPPYTRKTF